MVTLRTWESFYPRTIWLPIIKANTDSQPLKWLEWVGVVDFSKGGITQASGLHNIKQVCRYRYSFFTFAGNCSDDTLACNNGVCLNPSLGVCQAGGTICPDYFDQFRCGKYCVHFKYLIKNFVWHPKESRNLLRLCTHSGCHLEMIPNGLIYWFHPHLSSASCDESEIMLSSTTDTSREVSFSPAHLYGSSRDNIAISCLWLISSDPGTRVHLQPINIDFAGSWVYIGQGHDPADYTAILGRMYGVVSLRSISSETDKMFLISTRDPFSNGVAFVVRLFQTEFSGTFSDWIINCLNKIFEPHFPLK